MSVYVGEYVHMLAQQPCFVSWAPSLPPGMPPSASHTMDGCPGFANATPVRPQKPALTSQAAPSISRQAGWFFL